MGHLMRGVVKGWLTRLPDASPLQVVNILSLVGWTGTSYEVLLSAAGGASMGGTTLDRGPGCSSE